MTLGLRLATPADGAAVAAIYAPHVSHEATSFELVAPDEAEMGRRIAELTATYPWLVAEDGGDVVGYCYGCSHRARPGYRWSVEVSVYVSPNRHRGRVGRALYTALFEILAYQGFVNAFAGITLPNPASVGFHRAMGFAEIGTFHRIGYKLGGWHDVGWYERRLTEPEGQPREPVPVTVLKASGALDSYLGAG